MKKYYYLLLSLLMVPVVAYADVIDPIKEPEDNTQYLVFAVVVFCAVVITVIATIIKNKKGK